MREPLALAEALRAAHPNLEPLEADADHIARLLVELDGDTRDDRLVAEVIACWDGLLP
ncbi:MAG: hypothetical protein OEM67_05380 [Thermoleophilia bacterium]|nr:hypothetical protein [Thermoleophilia bacterium]MDH3725137.1 hypothetical protein [Thermoleophilia bacterium]